MQFFRHSCSHSLPCSFSVTSLKCARLLHHVLRVEHRHSLSLFLCCIGEFCDVFRLSFIALVLVMTQLMDLLLMEILHLINIPLAPRLTWSRHSVFKQEEVYEHSWKRLINDFDVHVQSQN